MDRIPVAGPWITQKEIDYVADAVRNAWYDRAGEYNRRFEEAFARHVGVRFAATLPSCTSAIHLSLLALGVGPGDEVIVPDITWIASAAPISYVGATPVFADVDRDSWCLAADSFRQCITARTKAAIPVDLYGNLPDLKTISEISQERGVALIEDAAEAVGSEQDGRRAGSFGVTGVFSFHGSKTLTTGEGGMLVTDREDLHRRALVLRDHGRPPGDRSFFNREVAYKYRMSGLQAALGLAQLERIDELIDRKRETFQRYRDALAEVEGIALNSERAGTRNSFWMVTVLVSPQYGIRKEELIRELESSGIGCRPFFHPLSSLPAYAGSEEARRAAVRNRTSYEISPYGVNLPSALSLTPDQVGHVCDRLKEILESRRR